MESVGCQLRQARLSLGLTLEQASAKTRISMKNLQAIEDDNLTRITSPFFYKSFVRQFADYLNFDYSRLAAAVEKVVSSMPEPLMPGQVPAADAAKPKIAPIEVKRRSWNLRWLSSLVSFVFMLVACSSFYGVWQNSRSNWRAFFTAYAASLAPASHKAPLAKSQPALAQISPAIPQPSPAAPSQNAMSAAADGTGKTNPANASGPEPTQASAAALQSAQPDIGVHVELSAVERTWLSIVSDGKEIFSGVLEAAETKVLDGRETARISTGNGGAINLVFNGRAIGMLKLQGQGRTVVFTKDNYEVLEASPRLALTRFNPSAE